MTLHAFNCLTCGSLDFTDTPTNDDQRCTNCATIATTARMIRAGETIAGDDLIRASTAVYNIRKHRLIAPDDFDLVAQHIDH